MGKLTLLEKIRHCGSHNEVLPLKGKIKVILEDVRDGTQKVVESENIQTNAVGTIMEKNWDGLGNMSALLPLRSLYGGVLLFEDEITENANNYDLPCETDNYLVAHAGDTAPGQGYTGSKRGTPVSNDFVITDTSIKQVWLWDNTQGNCRPGKQISTVCLCPAKLGNMGLTPPDATLNLWTQFAIANCTEKVAETTVTRAIAIKHPISINADGKTGLSIWWNGTSFEEIAVRHDWLQFGIMRNVSDFQEITSRTATVRTFNSSSASLFEDDDYYYLYEIESSTKLKIDKVKKLDFTVTQADITYSGIDFYTGTFHSVYSMICKCVPRFAYDGKYLYLPNNANTGFVAVNPNDNSDKFALDGTVSIRWDVWDMAENARPVVLNSGLAYGCRYMINGDTAYPIYWENDSNRAYRSTYASTANFGDLIRHGASVYDYPFRRSGDGDEGQGPCLLNAFASTISVLPEAKHKTTAQTMRVEYTSTEQTS